jgi:transcriptional regulator with PAS, ATPase and Fis domain
MQSSGGASRDNGRLTLGDFQSADAAMIRCLELARLACKTDLPILILGETGTGKTLLAHAIHNSSPRAAAAFVSFNAAALSETLLDSQLFGHEKGAFTGAHGSVRGKFELADRGTLFIDEVADMSPAAQAKILRAVEYGEFERLGGERIHMADVRLVSATHYALGTFLESTNFRRDLFYRLSGFTLTIPPLRERQNDLRALVGSHIARIASHERRSISGLSGRAAGLLFSHSWPGNLRELDRVIRAAVALTAGTVIGHEAILLQGVESAPGASAAAPPSDMTLAAAERRHVADVLQAFGGNKARAARALGISRSRLDRKLATVSK